jgi:glycosyltransferase involved in cell wall biosynthesis
MAVSQILDNSMEVLKPVAQECLACERDLAPASSHDRLRVLLLDLWCYIPHYDRYLCDSLAGENVEVTLGAVCPYQDPQYFVRSGLSNDPGLVDVVSKLGIRNGNLRRALMFVECCINMAALLARIAVSKMEIVHVQWIPMIRRLPFEMWFLRMLRSLGLKLVYTVHNVVPHDTGKQFVPVFRRVYAEMDALICHTDDAKRRLVREFSVDPERVWVIPHGPLLHDAERLSKEDARAALSLPKDETLVLWQGIIRPYKGLDFLLEGWRRIDASSLQARLIIAGTGEPKLLQEIRDQMAELGLEDSVHLDLRFIPNEELPTLYQASDVVVYPYKSVTASGALMTAMAFQKAIIATKLPAFLEVLQDQKTAHLIDYDDCDALAGSLRSLIQHPEERKRLSLGLASLNGFNSWSSIAKRTRQCYDSVLQRTRDEALSI